MKINRVVKILMERDGITKEEAIELMKDTQAELLDCTNVLEADDIIMSNLGLEPDYLYDILTI